MNRLTVILLFLAVTCVTIATNKLCRANIDPWNKSSGISGINSLESTLLLHFLRFPVDQVLIQFFFTENKKYRRLGMKTGN
jgi:hypothetical protein